MRANPNQSPNSPTPGQKEAFAKVWQKFAEAHPDWQIQFEFFSKDIGGEHARLLEQARAGRAPDCVTVDSFQLALFVTNGVLQPLDEYFSKEEIADLFPFIRDGITGADGHIYAWWWGTDLRVLYYNKDIVKTVPQTWDELQATALAASKTGVDGVLFNGGRWEGTTFDWLANFWAQGGALVDDSGKPIFGEGENRDKMLKALNYFKGLVDSGAAPKRVATIKDYNDFNAAAIAGTTAMFFGGHWQHFQLQEAMAPDAFAKWDIAELPGPTPGRARDRHRRLDHRRLRQGPRQDPMCAARDARGLHGAGQRGGRRPADAPEPVRLAAEVPGSLLRQAQGVPGARPRPPGRADLSRDLQPDPDHDGRGPVRRRRSPRPRSTGPGSG